jgi:hypothetical protein
VTFFGFEIQKKEFQTAQHNLEKYPSATVLNLGWDDHAAEGVCIAASGGRAGLYDPKGQRGFQIQHNATATTVSLDVWTKKNSIIMCCTPLLIQKVMNQRLFEA